MNTRSLGLLIKTVTGLTVLNCLKLVVMLYFNQIYVRGEVMLNKIIAALITVGGIGYINYAVAEQLGAAEFKGDKKTNQIAFSLVWSIVDFAIYLLVQKILIHWHVHGTWLLITSMLLTIVIVFLMAVIVTKPLQKLLYWFYNRAFKISHNAPIKVGTVWSNFFSGDQTMEVYCYDLQHQPIAQGFVLQNSMNSADHTLTLQPFESEDYKKQWFYEDMENISQTSNKRSHKIKQLVDFDNNLIIFAVTER